MPSCTVAVSSASLARAVSSVAGSDRPQFGSGHATRIADHLVRAWAFVYTLGLPADLRGLRRDEIDSDLWEQDREAEATRKGSVGTTLQVLARLVLGAPFDVAWRIEAGAALRSGKEPRMKAQPWTATRFLSLLVAVAVLPVPVAWVKAAGRRLIPAKEESGVTIAMLAVGANICVLPIGLGLLTIFWEAPSFGAESMALGAGEIVAGSAALAGLYVARANLATGLLFIAGASVAMAPLASWALAAVIVGGIALALAAVVRWMAPPPTAPLSAPAR